MPHEFYICLKEIDEAALKALPEEAAQSDRRVHARPQRTVRVESAPRFQPK